MARKNYVAIPPKPLKTDVLSTDSTFKLRDIVWYTGSDGVEVNLSASDFGSDNVGYGVFEPKTAREEWFTFSSANMATAVTGGLSITARGLTRTAPYTTESNARKHNHESGSIVLLYTNSPAFYDDFLNKDNDETVTGKVTFPTGANAPVSGTVYAAPTNDLEYAPKKYVDDIAIAGAPAATNGTAGLSKIATTVETIAETNDDGTYAYVIPVGLTVPDSAGAADEGKLPQLDGAGVLDQTFLGGARTWAAVQSFTADNVQIITDANSANDGVRFSMLQTVVSTDIPKGAVSGTSGEAITAGQGVYVKASDSKLYKTITTSDEPTFSFVGVALTTVAEADLTVQFAPPGHIVTGLTGLTAGASYYLTGTAGVLGTTPGARYAKIGRALSTTVLQVLEPKFIVRGSTTFGSVSSQEIITGFYPANIVINAAYSTVIDATQYHSFGDDSNRCIYSLRAGTGEYKGLPSATKAWFVSYGASVGSNQGTVSAKSATGFTLNCDTATGGNIATIQWTAYSE